MINPYVVDRFSDLTCQVGHAIEHQSPVQPRARRHLLPMLSTEILGPVRSADRTTVQRYLDLLTDALMIRQLPPFLTSIGKRQVKKMKDMIRD